MQSLPTILLVGTPQLVESLSATLPPFACRVVHTDVATDALDRATAASVVVVDARLQAGAEHLCQRLRGDPVTSQVPLVLRCHEKHDAPQARVDARIHAADFDGLVATIHHFVPEIGQAEQGESDAMFDDLEDQLFDDESMTVIWRRPDDQAVADAGGGWPPPPPTYDPGEDLVEFALNFAGYINSLLEALEDPSRLSGDEFERLSEVAPRAVTRTESCVDTVQSGMNEALMGKDLERMRVLSQAKNSLYEKLQTLRTLTPRLEEKRLPSQRPTAQPPTPRAAGGATPTPPPARATAPEPALDGPGDAAAPGLSFDDPTELDGFPAGAAMDAAAAGPPAGEEVAPAEAGARTSDSDLPAVDLQKKSALTIAAEEKERERVRSAQEASARREREARARAQREAQLSGTARVEGSRIGPLWIWIIVTFVVVVGSGVWIGYHLFSDDKPRIRSVRADNQPPRMQRATLSQTAAGVTVRPEATDPDGDRITYEIMWYVNGKRVPNARAARLAPRHYKAGDNVEAAVRPVDGYAQGRPMRTEMLAVKPLR